MMRVLYKLQKITQQLFLKQLVAFVQYGKLSTMKFVYDFFKSLWFSRLYYSIGYIIRGLADAPSPEGRGAERVHNLKE